MIKIEDLVRSNVLELAPYSCARDAYSGKDGIFLDANENPFGHLNRYPDPYQKELKQKLSALRGVDIDSIFIGNGSDEVIDLAFRLFCNPGQDKALTFSPTYGMYAISAAINNIELISVSLNQNFQIDLERVKPYLTDPTVKLIFICSPNNPTGNLMHKQDVEFILNNFGGLVIIDEAYIDFAEEESLITWVNQYKNLIVSQTFSKAWGLAAARVGTAYAHSAIIKLYNKIKPPYNVSEMSQQTVQKALENYKNYEDRLAMILKEKEKLKRELEQITLVKHIYPSDANFLLIEVENADELYNRLLSQKIIIRNRNTQVNNCIRISIGRPYENTTLINALKNIQ